MSIFNKKSDRTTLLQGVNQDPNRTTHLEDNSNPNRTTAILGFETDSGKAPDRTTMAMGSARPTLELSVENTRIGQYTIKKTITENTGEATLLLANCERGEVVLKVYHKDIKPKKELLSTMRKISDPHVMPLLDSGTWYERYYEMFPCYKERDLASCLPIDMGVLLQVVIPGINEGLHVLHENSIVHRDIKPSNIFFAHDHQSVVIGDFGISSILKTDMSVRATGMARTLGYAAPETSAGYISKESDYYSFGISLLHIVLGHDPFDGMTDMQIMYQTINEKMNIPMSINSKMRDLIMGLTIKDRTLRWGYKEVSDWIAGKAIELPNQLMERKTLDGKSPRPYRFANKYYSDNAELAKAFSSDWVNASKHLYRGLTEKYLLLYGEDLASQCMDLREMKDKDAAVFRLIYLLNPSAPLNYRGTDFETVSNLGRYMIKGWPTSKNVVAQMITNGSLRYYLELHQQCADAFKEKLIAVENSSKLTDETYLEIGYILDPLSKYEVAGHTFDSVDELAAFLASIPREKCESTCNELMSSIFFPAWVRSQGYEEQVNKWQASNEKAEW